MCNGKVFAAHFFRFANTADRDAFDAALVSLISLTNARGGKNYLYNAASGPTEIAMVIIWENAAAFAVTEHLFGLNTVVQGMIGKGLTLEAWFCGALTSESRAAITKWNDAPGFEITACDSEIEYADAQNGGLAHDGMGAFGVFEHSSEAARDGYMQEAKATSNIWMARSNLVIHANVSATKSIHIWMTRSKADTLTWLNGDLKSEVMQVCLATPSVSQLSTEAATDAFSAPRAQPLLAFIPSMASFGGVVFGNIGDPEIASGLAPWSTWKLCPLMSGSLGGNFYSFLQKAAFKSPAARDAAIEALKTGLDGVGAGGCYFGCPVGESQAFMVHDASDEAGNKAVQAGFGANPSLLGTFTDGNITHLPHFNAGNVQNTWATDIQGWADVIPAIKDTADPLVCCRDGGSFGPDSFTLIQECQFNDAAGYDVFIDVMSDAAVVNEPIKYNHACWKTSSTTATQLYTFGSSDDWVECNKNFFPHAEKINAAMKKADAYVSGSISDAAQAALDAWAEAPWCDITTVERVGKMGN